jgi:hypothetical protein
MIAFNKPPFTERKTDCLGESALAYLFLEQYLKKYFQPIPEERCNGNDAFNLPPNHGMK